jgi:methionine sulfoxide reductase heme-binding subunit
MTTASAQQQTKRQQLSKLLLHPATKPVLFLIFLMPVAWLIYGTLADELGANPAEKIIRETGEWTLKFLCLTLTITPLRQWTNMPAWARLRRMLGLFAFFYASLHFTSYAGLDKEWAPDDIWRDILKRPFILVGSSALLLMTPLALTSFNRAIKALGGKRWQLLHKLVYAVVLLGLLHFFWMRAGKNNFSEVAVYALAISSLLGWRVIHAIKQARIKLDN